MRQGNRRCGQTAMRPSMGFKAGGEGASLLESAATQIWGARRPILTTKLAELVKAPILECFLRSHSAVRSFQ